jgi:hypothetical protein
LTLFILSVAKTNWAQKQKKNSTETVPRNRQMFGQILSSVTGLATSWLDSKAQQKLLETEIKKSSSLVKLNWELEAIRSTQNSWKDELCAIDYAAALVV